MISISSTPEYDGQIDKPQHYCMYCTLYPDVFEVLHSEISALLPPINDH